MKNPTTNILDDIKEVHKIIVAHTMSKERVVIIPEGPVFQILDYLKGVEAFVNEKTNK